MDRPERVVYPPKKECMTSYGQAGKKFIISKNLFPLYPPVFVREFLDLLKNKTRRSPHTVQPTR